jgi:Fe-S oxidoreductase
VAPLNDLDPDEPAYWSEEALRESARRTFSTCAGCRQCGSACDLFPELFALLDRRHDGLVEALTTEERGRILDACFGCGDCRGRCPWSPGAGRETAVDLLRLAERWRAQRWVKKGTPLPIAVVADPVASASLDRASFSLASRAIGTRSGRWLLEALGGPPRGAPLPRMAGSSFLDRARRAGRIGGEPAAGRVLFLPCCGVEDAGHTVGDDALFLLDRLGAAARVAESAPGCGAGLWENGDLEGLRVRARATVETLLPWVDAGGRVALAGGRCVETMRERWPELVRRADREAARQVAAGVFEVAELLLQAPGRPAAPVPRPLRVAWHRRCGSAVASAAQRLIEEVPGHHVLLVSLCCAQGRTWGLQAAHHDASRRLGQRAWDGMVEAEADLWVSECDEARRAFDAYAGRRAMHPVEVLAALWRGREG